MCDDNVVAAVTKKIKHYFSKNYIESMSLDTAADDFCVLAPRGVPYAYWDFDSEDHKKWQKLMPKVI